METANNKLKKSPKIRPPDHLSIPEHQPRHFRHNGDQNVIIRNQFRRSSDSSSNPWIQKPLYKLQQNDGNPEPSLTLNYGTYEYNNTHHNHHKTENIEENDDNDNFGHEMERHLTLFDLTSIGIGGTIGSGIFVLCGLIAHSYAGPATFISWTIAGIAAMLSGFSYAELSARLPSAGSAYVYVYASMGELPAMVVAGCLTLEYIAAASAVARSWGEKVVEFLLDDVGIVEQDSHFLFKFIMGPIATQVDGEERLFNPMAFLVSFLSVVLLMKGVKESKAVTNFMTMTKVGVVLFMTVGGLVLMKPENLKPMIPTQFGWAGIFRGATSSFFGYLGYDEICCIAGEAQNPKKNIPYSILWTLVICMSIYITAAISLAGMQPYELIDGVEGFPGAFYYNGVPWAAQLTATGEIITLPIVVLITIMAQPRLQYALAQDGLLPPWFAQLDSTGNLRNGTIASGTIMVLIASFVPFTHLNDMISAGVLVAFSMTSSALLLLRHESPASTSYDGRIRDSFLMEKLVAVFNASAFVGSIMMTHFMNTYTQQVIAIFLCIVMITSCFFMWLLCPQSKIFGGEKRRRHPGSPENHHLEGDDGYFKTPLLPLLPCVAIFINWYLTCQLELFSVFLLALFLAACGLFYFIYGAKNSLLRKYQHGGAENEIGEPGVQHYFSRDDSCEEEDIGSEEHHKLLLRSISLPRVSKKKPQEIVQN